MWGIDPLRNILIFKTVGKNFITKELPLLGKSLELACGEVDDFAGAQTSVPSPRTSSPELLVSMASLDQKRDPTISICPALRSEWGPDGAPQMGLEVKACEELWGNCSGGREIFCEGHVWAEPAT